MKPQSEKKPGKTFWILLMMIFLSSIPAAGTPLNEEINDCLPASKEYYTRAEVTALVERIWTIALEEMEQTALETAREAAADEAENRAAAEAVSR